MTPIISPAPSVTGMSAHAIEVRSSPYRKPGASSMRSSRARTPLSAALRVDDLAARVGEQQTHAGAFELIGHLVQDRGSGPLP
jgi:hypothetical protein